MINRQLLGAAEKRSYEPPLIGPVVSSLFERGSEHILTQRPARPQLQVFIKAPKLAAARQRVRRAVLC